MAQYWNTVNRGFVKQDRAIPVIGAHTARDIYGSARDATNRRVELLLGNHDAGRAADWFARGG